MNTTETQTAPTYSISATTMHAGVATRWRMTATKFTTNNFFQETSATMTAPVATQQGMTITKMPSGATYSYTILC